MCSFSSCAVTLRLVDGNDGDDGERCASRLPALGTAAGVVVNDVAGDRDFDLIGRAMALERTAGERAGALLEAVVDQRVERRICHVLNPLGRLFPDLLDRFEPSRGPFRSTEASMDDNRPCRFRATRAPSSGRLKLFIVKSFWRAFGFLMLIYYNTLILIYYNILRCVILGFRHVRCCHAKVVS